jgi:hypothetical protein
MADLPEMSIGNPALAAARRWVACRLTSIHAVMVGCGNALPPSGWPDARTCFQPVSETVTRCTTDTADASTTAGIGDG